MTSQKTTLRSPILNYWGTRRVRPPYTGVSRLGSDAENGWVDHDGVKLEQLIINWTSGSVFLRWNNNCEK